MSHPSQTLRQPVVVVLGHVDSGKCISGDTLLELADGQILSAESAFERFKVGEAAIKPDGEVYEAKGLELLSVGQDGSVSQENVTYVWKLRANRLVRVKTKAWFEVKTTPEHRFLVFTPEREVRYVEAEKLRLGDHLLVPNQTRVRPWTLRRIKLEIVETMTDEFLIRPDPILSERIEAHCRASGISNLGRTLGDKNLYFHVRKGYYRASIFKELAVRLGVPDEELYDRIAQIKFSSRKQRATHKSFWLAIPHTKVQFAHLFYALGLLYGDGLHSKAYLSNTSHTLIRRFRRSIKAAFGVGSGVAWRKTSYIVSHEGGKTLSRFLVESFGCPDTDKTRVLSVPSLISAAPDTLLARFLRGFFDAEGYVEKRNNIGIGCESRRLITQLPMLLHRFGCLAHFAKKTKSELVISGSKNLEAFINNVGFSEPRKRRLARAAALKSQSSRVFDMTPVSGNFVGAFREVHNVKGDDRFQLNYYQSRRQLTNYALSKLLPLSGGHEELALESVLGNFRMVEVIGVDSIEGEFAVYDFTIETTHNFLANNLILHNTSLLDKIRGTAVQAREAGGITQQIGASYFPLETLQKICGPLLSKAGGELQVPGLLVIDTPGHEIFSNLRLRGGSAADIAIVVVDVMKGLENQTLESIDILKQRRVPFIIALNKIDMIKGWKKGIQGPLIQAMKGMPPEWNDELEERLYNVVGGLLRLGFQSDAYYRVKDFRQQVSIVPVSARQGQGIPELLAMLIGLAQQYLKGKLIAIDENHAGRGIIIEMQEEAGIGQTANVILTEGALRVGDNIVLVKRGGAVKSKVKALFMPKPLDEMRDPRDKFTSVSAVYAAAGVKLVSSDLPGVVAGTSVAAFNHDSDFEALRTEMEKELKSVVVKTDNMGVIVKAGNVGGLEALLRMLEQRGIPIRQADIGDISRNDIVDASVVGEHDPYLAAILAFDVKVLQDAREFAGGTPMFISDVIYEVIDNYVNWAAKKREEDERAALSNITPPCKLKALPGMFFRRNDPAVFGVEILAGKLRPKLKLMASNGEELGVLEQIQDEGKSLAQAKIGDKVAISVKGPTLGRQIKENDVIYTLPRSHDAKLLRSKFLSALSQDDLEALEEIVRVKSASDPFFGF